jgi:hypothetical protein
MGFSIRRLTEATLAKYTAIINDGGELTARQRKALEGHAMITNDKFVEALLRPDLAEKQWPPEDATIPPARTVNPTPAYPFQVRRFSTQLNRPVKQVARHCTTEAEARSVVRELMDTPRYVLYVVTDWRGVPIYVEEDTPPARDEFSNEWLTALADAEQAADVYTRFDAQTGGYDEPCERRAETAPF